MKLIVQIFIIPDDHLDDSPRNKTVSQSYVVNDVALPSHMKPVGYVHAILRELVDNVHYQANQCITEVMG